MEYKKGYNRKLVGDFYYFNMDFNDSRILDETYKGGVANEKRDRIRAY